MIVHFLRKRIGGQALFDFVAWIAVVYLAGYLRFEFDLDRLVGNSFLMLGAAIAVLHWVLGKFLHLYGARYGTASFDELLVLGLVTALSSLPALVITLVWGSSWGIPRSIVLIAAPLFFVTSGSVRLIRRLRNRYASSSAAEKRAIVYGAGAMAEVLIPQLLSDSSRKYLPVGLLMMIQRKPSDGFLA